MTTRTLACGVLAGLAVMAPVSAASAAPAPHSGVVVDYRAASGTATVAAPGGRLVAVHTARRARPGTRVRLARMAALANGTYSGTVRAIGRARRARVRGTVAAHVGGGAIAVSARGTTFVVRLGAVSGRAKRSQERDAQPPVGTEITTTVTIGADGRLGCDGVHQVAPPAAGAGIEVEGRVSAIDPGARTVTLTAEDDGLQADFVIAVPDGIDITAYAVGDEVEASVVVGADGGLTLQGSSLNSDDSEADDVSDDQGDQEHACDGQDGHRSGGGSEDDGGEPGDAGSPVAPGAGL